MSPEFHPPNCSSTGQVDIDSDEKTGNWYSREYLPHFDRSNLSQAITFRLTDTLPSQKLKQIKRKTRRLQEDVRDRERHKKIEQWLDQGVGNIWLKNPEIAGIVHRTFLYHDEEKYLLNAWVVMPNHVHVLVTPESSSSLSDIVHSWKSYTAQKINEKLDRSGTVWQRGYYDRYVRNIDHFWTIARYIERNPVKAQLCSHPGEWTWSSASYRKERGIQVMDYDME